MAKPTYVRLSDEVHDAVENFATEKDTTITFVIEQVLRRAFGLPFSIDALDVPVIVEAPKRYGMTK